MAPETKNGRKIESSNSIIWLSGATTRRVYFDMEYIIYRTQCVLQNAPFNFGDSSQWVALGSKNGEFSILTQNPFSAIFSNYVSHRVMTHTDSY